MAENLVQHSLGLRLQGSADGSEVWNPGVRIKRRTDGNQVAWSSVERPRAAQSSIERRGVEQSGVAWSRVAFRLSVLGFLVW